MVGIIVATFVASLLGSVHCVGMCGPFAMIASAGTPEKESDSTGTKVGQSFRLAFFYNFGRLCTYLVFGVFAGILGLALDFSGQFLGFQQAAIYFAGITLILAGAIGLLRNYGFQLGMPRTQLFLTRFLSRRVKSIRNHQPTAKAFLLGMITSLMPCGWLYFFVIAASSTQSIVMAPVVMSIFWLGTLPVMQFLGSFAGIVNSLRKNVGWLIPCLMLFVGIYSLTCRSPIEMAASELTKNNDDVTTTITSFDISESPCCHDDNP